MALVSVAAIGWLYANRGFVRFTPFEQDAGDLLEQLITDSKLPVARAGAVERLAADGTQPDAAMQMLVIPATANIVRAGLRQGCRRAGLGRPDAMTLGSDPDALCAGEWQGGTATISVRLRCARSCRADIGVYHLWF